MAGIGINSGYGAGQVNNTYGAQGACGACGASGAGSTSETEKGNATDTFDKPITWEYSYGSMTVTIVQNPGESKIDAIQRNLNDYQKKLNEYKQQIVDAYNAREKKKDRVASYDDIPEGMYKDNLKAQYGGKWMSFYQKGVDLLNTALQQEKDKK